MRFRDRVEAGQLLGEKLLPLGLRDPVVLGLPRGGVVVAAQISGRYDVPTEVFIVRKIGHPQQPELGLGAISEGSDPTYDEQALRRYGLSADMLAPTVAAERSELARRVAAYRGDRALPALTGRDVVLVDDGVATGGTARSAVRALRAQQPARLVFAAPVAPPAVTGGFSGVDDVVILHTPAHFVAVGQWYDDFAQVSDDEVVRLLGN